MKNSIRLEVVNKRVSVKKEMFSSKHITEKHIGFMPEEIIDLNDMLNISSNKDSFEHMYLRKLVNTLSNRKKAVAVDVVKTRLLDALDIDDDEDEDAVSTIDLTKAGDVPRC